MATCEELEARLEHLETVLSECKPICIKDSDGHLEELDIDTIP